MELYIYQASLVKVVDGDTIDALVEVGFHLTAKLRLRLLGVDAAELSSPDPAERAKAIEAKRWLAQQLSIQGSFLIRTEKSDSFGRYLADVYLGDIHMNKLMVDLGIAAPWLRRK